MVAYTTTPVDPEVPGSEEARVRFAHQNPISWRRWHPPDGALRFSAMQSPRERDCLEFYRYYLRPNGVQDSLKVWLWSSLESAACIVLDRGDAEFCRRDQDLLGILQQHLIEMRMRALADAPATACLWVSP